MAEAVLCPACGKTVAADAPQGLCPACMMRAGLEIETSEFAESQTIAPLPPATAADCAAPASAVTTDEFATLPPNTPRAESMTEPASTGATFADIPGYEILGELGRGGMGVVYKARHKKLGRLVALKMILAGSNAGEADLSRFRTEAEAIARVKHANIIQIYEIGEHEEKPYFALEYCDGGSLALKLNGTPMQPAEAARRVEVLAHGMDAAHQQGITHRDLKPANVLLADDGTLKITDFGLAKKLEDAGQTQSGAIMGTPSYMAPEQAGGKTNKLGPPADIYTLGPILYELLTGRPPFKAATQLDTILQVVADEPVPPSQLQNKMPRDVETICLKCLQMDPAKRYASATALADDLRRYQNGEPILARPVGKVERVAKWVKRRPMVVGLIATVAMFAFIAFTGISGGFGWALVERENAIGQERKTADALTETKKAQKKAEEEKSLADKARAEAETATKETKRQLSRVEHLLYISQFAEAYLHFQRHDLIACRLALDECRVDLRGPEYGYLLKQIEKKASTLRGQDAGVVFNLALSGDGKRLFSASCAETIKDKEVTLEAGKEVGTFRGAIAVWDLEAGKEVGALPGLQPGFAMLLSSDGKRLFSGAGRTIQVWDLEARKVSLTLRIPSGIVRSLAISRDGKRLFSGSWMAGEPGDKIRGDTIKVWDLETAKEVGTLGRHRGGIHVLVPSSDGKKLYSGSEDATIKVWDLEAGKEVSTLRGHTYEILSLVLSSDGKRLFSGSHDTTIKVWDVETGKEVRTLRGHKDKVVRMALSGDGKRLFSSSGDNSIKVWDPETGKEISSLRGHTSGVFSLALSGDGKRLLSGGADGTIKAWLLDADDMQPLSLLGHFGYVTRLALSDDGKRLFSGGEDKTIKVCDLDAGKEVSTLRGPKGPIGCLALVTVKSFARRAVERMRAAAMDWLALVGQRQGQCFAV